MTLPVEEKPGFASALFPGLPVGRRAALWTLAFLTYAVVVGIVSEQLDITRIGWGTEATAAIGLIVGFLVSFRNNAAYSRWWEARQLWGKLVNDSRNLALKAVAYTQAGQEDREELARLLAGFAHALRLHLRGSVKLQDVPGYEKAEGRPGHVPTMFADGVFRLLARWGSAHHVELQMLRALDLHAYGLMDVCGGCERIRNTPIPPSPSGVLQIAFWFYLITAPGFILNEVGWWGLVPLGLGVFLLIAVELAATAMEQPFGISKDHLQLDRYCEVIERSVHEILRDRSVMVLDKRRSDLLPQS
jgi:putative membrane protein